MEYDETFHKQVAIFSRVAGYHQCMGLAKYSLPRVDNLLEALYPHCRIFGHDPYEVTGDIKPLWCFQ